MAIDRISSNQITDATITAADLAANSVDSSELVDGSIDTSHIAADAVTGAKIADDAINSEHYTDGSIDTAHIAASQVTVAKMAANSVDSDQYVDGSIDTAHMADNQVTLAKMAGLARGTLIYGNASGDPATLAAGSANYVLTSDGTDLSWTSGNVALSTLATTVTITDNENTNENNAIVFTAGGDVDGGSLGLESDGDLTYNPSTGTLSVTNIVVSGTQTITDSVTMNASNAVVFEGATADAHETTLSTIDATGDRTINLPNASGTIPVLGAASTVPISSTPDELNILDGATVVVGEINALDLGATAVGTAIASKAVILDGNKDYTGLRNLTITGELDAATLDISGNVDIDGVLETDNLTVGGAQGTDGQLLTSTGSGVGWEDAPSSGATALDGLSDATTSETNSIMLGTATHGSISGAAQNTSVGIGAMDAITAAEYTVAIGYNSATALTSGNYNTAVGGNAFITSQDGHSNTAIGMSALKVNEGGHSNVSVGRNSLIANVDGVQCTVVGMDAMKTATSDDGAAVFGYLAGRDMDGATHTTLIGAYAGYKISTGDKNTFVGTESGPQGSAGTGDENIGVGYTTLAALTSGASNTALGTAALATNTDGNNNTAVGYQALYGNISGDYNTALGWKALVDTTTNGNGNIGIGYDGGRAITTGDNNVAIGIYAMGGANAKTGDDNICIGRNTGNDLSSAGYNVIIGGNAAPLMHSGDGRSVIIGQGAGAALTTAGYNVAIGEEALASNQTNIYNVALGNSALKLSTTHHNTAVGHLAGGTSTSGNGKNVFVGKNAIASAATGERQVVLGYNADGWQNGGFVVEIDGDYTRIDIGSSTVTGSSDQRQKEEIITSTAGLSFINDLRPVTFKWKKKKDLPNTFKQYVEVGSLDINGIAYTEEDANERIKGNDQTTNHGFIAQEVKTAIDAHSEIKDGHKLWYQDSVDSAQGDIQNIAPAALIPMLVKALQEADDKIDALTSRVTTLEG
jgi:hypothetical protein